MVAFVFSIHIALRILVRTLITHYSLLITHYLFIPEWGHRQDNFDFVRVHIAVPILPS